VTVAAVEAAPAAVGSGSAAAARPLPSPRPSHRGRRATGPSRRGSRRRSRTAASPTVQASHEQAGQLLGTRRHPRSRATSGNYQGVILAEFVAAVVLVALTPIAANKKQQTQSGGLSPYAGQDMIKLAAITVVYLILALLSVRPGPGRFAAWFGGLILLAVGLNEAAHLADVLDLFGGVKTAASSTASKAAAGVTQVGNTIAGRG